MDGHRDTDPRVRRTKRDVVRAAGELLMEGGWSAVTHAAVASRAGYSKATLYNHWPEPADLGRAAFAQACPPPHYEPIGDLRTDVIGDLTALAGALVDQHVGRVLAALAERAPDDPPTAELLRSFVTEGTSRLRRILAEHGHDEARIEPLLDLLCGAVVYRVVFRQLPADAGFIEAIVDHALEDVPTG